MFKLELIRKFKGISKMAVDKRKVIFITNNKVGASEQLK
jgi:hypothetical protein